MLNYIVFRYRRQIRRFARDIRLYRRLVVNYFERHILGRWYQVRLSRRFIIVWVGLVAVMSVGLWLQIAHEDGLAVVLRPMVGGTFTEGAVGTVKILNPILPESENSADINKLIFSGLTQVGQNRQIEPDLAESWDISQDGRTYTFHLRHGVKWQDGVPFTARDVVFTLEAIQNPDSRSPLASSWQGVTAVAKDDYTVVYTLPNPYTPFLQSTTVGIVPSHLMENIDPSTLRENSINQNPVGTGPFKMQTFAPDAGEITLVANPDYYGGRPKMDAFSFKFYSSDAEVLNAYAKRQVIAVGRLHPDQSAKAAMLPRLGIDNFYLPSETTLFFKTTDKVMTDQKLRLALAKSLDRSTLINQSEPDEAQPQSQPIMPGQPGYTTKYQTDKYDLATAKSLLASSGYSHQTLSLVTLGGGELEAMAKQIQKQWAKLGVSVKLTAVPIMELEQTYIRPRNYQMLLYGVNVGGDPDVYAFWHSSQANDPGLNLSQYNSAAADQALESGRIKSDPQVRSGKYDAFLKTWDADEPAMVIDSSIYRYGVSRQVAGVGHGAIINPEDRFYDVQGWTMLQKPIRQ